MTAAEALDFARLAECYAMRAAVRSQRADLSRQQREDEAACKFEAAWIAASLYMLGHGIARSEHA